MPTVDVLRDTGIKSVDGPMRQTQFPGLSLKWEKVATLLWMHLMRLLRACEYQYRKSPDFVAGPVPPELRG